MKKLLFVPILICLMMTTSAFAGNPNGDDQESSKVNLWIPGFLVKIVAGIAEDHIDKDEREALELFRKIGNVTICVREGEYYSDRSDKKMTRKLNRMEKRDYTTLVSVISEGEKVNLSIKENRNGKIKRMVVLVDDVGESFVFVKMNCRISIDDIALVSKKYISN